MSKSNCASPLRKDFQRKVNYDAEGKEFITYPEVDYRELQKANGSFLDWSLDSLLKAGVNPDFPIHTGLNTRLEGLSVVEDASKIADEIFSETVSKSE